MQWRWDHDRDAVIAEDAVRDREELNRREKVNSERKAYLKAVTLEDLRNHVFFSGWEIKEYPPAKMIQASREIMRRTVEQLFDLGCTVPEKAQNGRVATVHRIV